MNLYSSINGGGANGAIIHPSETNKETDEVGYMMTSGWKCAICFEYASVFMIDVTLCEDHARRHNFGYGDRLLDLREEYDRRSKEADNKAAKVAA